MMFKRSRLRLAKALVNARLALGVIFLAAACSSPEAPPPEPPAPTGVELPIIWGSQPLLEPISDIGLAGDGSPQLLVVFENGDVQTLDLEGDPLSQPAALDIAYIDDGHSVNYGGVRLTMFPGINAAGEPKLYAISADLAAPLALDLPIPTDAIAGLCSAPASRLAGDNHLFRLAYWTPDAPERQELGQILQENGDILWRQLDTSQAEGNQRACDLGNSPVNTPGKAISFLDYGEQHLTLGLGHEGDLQIRIDDDARYQPLTLRAGITIPALTEITAMAGAPRIRVGGYPKGIIILAGRTSEDDYRVVFVDPSSVIRPTSS